MLGTDRLRPVYKLGIAAITANASIARKSRLSFSLIRAWMAAVLEEDTV
jgi:hypothetical protein